MPEYLTYPSVDENYNFPDPVYHSIHRAKTLGSTNLNSLRDPGLYAQPYSSGATTALNYPTTTSGYLNVIAVANRFWQWFSADSGRGEFRRVGTATSWNPWEDMTSTIKYRGLLGSLDLNTVLQDGIYYQKFSGNATLERNYPIKGYTGEFRVATLEVATQTRSQEFLPINQSVGRWRRTSSSGVWGEWYNIDSGGGGSSSAIPSAADERAVRVDRARHRVGGVLGTNGLPTIALRFDDAADAFDSVVFPELQSRNLPAGWASGIRNTEEEGSVPWSRVETWARHGIELLGHSWTHRAASGEAAIRKEIIESADYIEDKVPSAAVDTWVMPGTGSGDYSYQDPDDGDFGSGNIESKYYTHLAGRMLQQRYAVIDGGLAGLYRRLTGYPAIGQPHGTFEGMTLVDAKKLVEESMAAGGGITLMAHSSRFGTSGFMSIEDLKAFLDWLVQLRDDEKLHILTPRGQAFANKSVSERTNLLPSVRDLSKWGNSNYYTLNPNGLWITSSADGRPLTLDISLGRWNHLRGGNLELVALVRTPNGSSVRTTLVGSLARSTTHAMSASTKWRWVRTVLSYPNNTPWNGSATVQLGRSDQGIVEIAEAYLRPI